MMIITEEQTKALIQQHIDCPDTKIYRLTKRGPCEDPRHPSAPDAETYRRLEGWSLSPNPGYTITGIEMSRPEPGRSFKMLRHSRDGVISLGMVQTSTVVEYDEENGVIRTKNSVYDLVELRTAYQWIETDPEFEGITVYDPDGWRYDDGVAMETPICKSAMRWRLHFSAAIRHPALPPKLPTKEEHDEISQNERLPDGDPIENKNSKSS